MAGRNMQHDHDQRSQVGQRKQVHACTQQVVLKLSRLRSERRSEQTKCVKIQEYIVFLLPFHVRHGDKI